jgi:hypothetical protein
MKKVFLASLVLLSLSLGACKKNYICLCTVESTGTPNIVPHDLNNKTKKDAEFDCNKKDKEAGQSCVLKDAN